MITLAAFIQFLEALPGILWPLVALYVIVSFRRQLSSLIDSAKERKFTLEVGGQKLSIEEANRQYQFYIQDLQEQYNELRESLSTGRKPSNLEGKGWRA